MGNPVRVQISPRAPLLTRVGKHLLARVSHLSDDLSESGPRMASREDLFDRKRAELGWHYRSSVSFCRPV